VEHQREQETHHLQPREKGEVARDRAEDVVLVAQGRPPLETFSRSAASFSIRRWSRATGAAPRSPCAAPRSARPGARRRSVRPSTPFGLAAPCGTVSSSPYRFRTQRRQFTLQVERGLHQNVRASPRQPALGVALAARAARARVVQSLARRSRSAFLVLSLPIAALLSLFSARLVVAVIGSKRQTGTIDVVASRQMMTRCQIHEWPQIHGRWSTPRREQ
jgi:hypothetical protein